METLGGTFVVLFRRRISENLPRQFQFLFRRKLRVKAFKRLRLPLRDKVSVRRRVLAANAAQVSRRQFFAQEKRGVRTFRQAVIANAKLMSLT